MTSRMFRSGSLLAFAWLALVSPALAQAEAGSEPPRVMSAVEITPYISMGSPTSPRVGAAISVPLTPNLSLETEVGYRKGEGDIDALSSTVSMLYSLPRAGVLAPYVAAGVGLEEYGTPVPIPGRAEPFTQSKLAFAVNAGGGVKVPVTDKWGVRSDARWFKALGRHGSEHWRLYHGAWFGVGKRGDGGKN